MRQRTALAPPDPWMFATVAGLIAIGLVMVFSASSATAYATYHDTAYFLKRQLIWLVIGGGFAYAAYRIDYTKLKRISPTLVGITVLLLVLTLIPHIGLQTGGARRWLGASILSFQPSGNRQAHAGALSRGEALDDRRRCALARARRRAVAARRRADRRPDSARARHGRRRVS